jgi:hypothetical protein
MNSTYVDTRVLEITQLIKTYSFNFIEETKAVVIKPKSSLKTPETADFKNLFEPKESLLLLPSSTPVAQVPSLPLLSLPYHETLEPVKEESFSFKNRNSFKIEGSIFL